MGRGRLLVVFITKGFAPILFSLVESGTYLAVVLSIRSTERINFLTRERPSPGGVDANVAKPASRPFGFRN